MQLKRANVLLQQLKSPADERISKAWELSFLGIHEILPELCYCVCIVLLTAEKFFIN